MASIETQKKAFVRREGQVYYEVYEEIRQEVERYAREKKLTAVVRFNDVPSGPGDPKSVLQHINRQVIWHDGTCDLTRTILGRLKKKSKQEEAEAAEEPPAKESSDEEPSAEELRNDTV